LSERRLKHSPILDVAGSAFILFCFDNALNRQTQISGQPENDLPVLQQWHKYWYTWFRFPLEIILRKNHASPYIAEDPDQLKILLDAYLLEKAVYEIWYQLNNRPDWLKVPLRSILDLVTPE